MRVVAGTYGGRRLEAPKGHDVRPTSDRVRESVFAALDSMGAIEGARALDLFAGTGALGIEALSRGAASVTFVEQHPKAFGALRANLAHLGLDGDERVTVRRGDGVSLVEHLGGFDLVLLDPPYAFDGWAGLLANVGTASAGAVVVIEAGRRTEVPLPDGWRNVREKRYGSTVVVMAHVPPPDGADTVQARDGR